MGTISIGSYLGRVVLALLVLCVVAWVALRVARSMGWARQNSKNLRVISSLSIGRDIFFILRCGPDVLGVITGNGGPKLVCRWKYEEWLAFEEPEKNADSK